MKVYKQKGKFFMEDNGKIVELTPNEDYYLKLPINSCNRVWVSCKKVDNATNQCVDYGTDVKVARVLGPHNSDNRKPLEDYLEGKDREKYLALVEKAKKAREEANKKRPMTELEKARAMVEKWQAKVTMLSK